MNEIQRVALMFRFQRIEYHPLRSLLLPHSKRVCRFCEAFVVRGDEAEMAKRGNVMIPIAMHEHLGLISLLLEMP